MNMKRTLSTTAAIALSVGMLAGCASTAQLEELKAEVAKATEQSEMASTKADKASATADTAYDAAKDAQSTANSAKERANAAMDAATAARRTADNNSERLERILQKSMAK